MFWWQIVIFFFLFFFWFPATLLFRVSIVKCNIFSASLDPRVQAHTHLNQKDWGTNVLRDSSSRSFSCEGEVLRAEERETLEPMKHSRPIQVWMMQVGHAPLSLVRWFYLRSMDTYFTWFTGSLATCDSMQWIQLPASTRVIIFSPPPPPVPLILMISREARKDCNV